jgi:hypothetical protein
MRFFPRLFGTFEARLAAAEPPWGSRPSLYGHIAAHRVPGTRGLAEDGEGLPDEDELFEPGELRWAGGALDGVWGHHGGRGDVGAAVQNVLARLKATLENPTRSTLAELYAALRGSEAIGLVDSLLDEIAQDGGVDAGRLQALGRWLASRAADREPVKVGIALLGAVPAEGDHELLLTLALHEEFTLYAAVAIANHGRDVERSLWAIAQEVDGWGRIQVVERLATTRDPEIQAWLLREGYKNSILNEYLAYTCARAGDLHGALAAEEVDDALLDAAGDLLCTLILGQGGPAEGIDDYEEGAAVTQAYLRHLDGRANRLDQFLVLKIVERFLAKDGEGWEERAQRGWTAEARASMRASIQALVGQDKWRSLAEAAVRTSEGKEFWVACEAAEALGLDTWPEHYARTQAGGDFWYHLMRSPDRARIARVVELAEAQLPLAELATGPGREHGLGPEFRHHRALDWVLQNLGAFPGLGWNLVQAGLRSPVVRNRNMALHTLEGWGEASWPLGAREAVERAFEDEPDEDLRERFTALLAGAPPPA